MRTISKVGDKFTRPSWDSTRYQSLPAEVVITPPRRVKVGVNVKDKVGCASKWGIPRVRHVAWNYGGGLEGYTHNWQVEICERKTHRGQKICLLAWIKRCCGLGAATGESRAGRCQVEREVGRTSEVKSTAWHEASGAWRQRRWTKWRTNGMGKKRTKMGSNERNVKQCCQLGVGRGGKSGQMRRARA